MKKTVFKFFALLSLAMFFAGCNNLLNDINDGKNDVSSKVTLKGSLALEGDAVPGEFLAMAAGGSARYAVAGGLMLSDYGFSLSAIETGTTSGENSKTINATVKNGNEFSITLDADKNYIFSLSLSSGDTITSGTSLTISRIMFGENEAGSKSVSLNGLTADQLTSTKVYFFPSTTDSGTGKIALEIDSTAENVKYVGYSFSKSDNYGYSGSGTVAFDTNKAAINVTKGAEKGGDSTPLPNGIYDFTFEFYESNPETNSNDSPVAIAYQKINVFAGFVTDTWISDGSAYFSEDAGKSGKFTVTQTAIDAYKYPKEFYVNGYATDSGSWNGGDDSYAGTSIKKPFQTLQQAIDTVIEANAKITEADRPNYKIYVKGTIYPKNYGTDSEPDYKMANFNALSTTSDKNLNLSIVGVGSDATLSGKTSGDDTTATTYGAIVMIGSYDEYDGENNFSIPNLNLTLENLTIRDGSVRGGYAREEGPGGAGIFNYGGTVTLKDCTITENSPDNNGSGFYCLGDDTNKGTIIVDNTTITSNNGESPGVRLEDSILKIKNTLTLDDLITIAGSSTITNYEGNNATIKCGENKTLGISVSYSEEAATLTLTGNLAFEGFSTSTGILLNAFEDDEMGECWYGRLTLDGKITGLSVELEASDLYGLISLGENYSTQSTISVKSSYSIESEKVFINGCNAEKAATFIEVSDYNNEYYTVTEGGYLQAATLTQARFRTYCSELYASNNYSDKMTLEIPDGSEVVTGNDGLYDAYKYVKSIKIPECYIAITSTDVEGGVFSDCTTYLEEVTLPESMVIIGDYAFNYCNNLNSINIPNSVKTIGQNAFSQCSSLTNITIPNSVTCIGSDAFGHSGLGSITIPSSVTSIGVSAFQYCSSLTSVEIPNSITTIGDYMFHGCSALTSINIPNSVTSIGTYAFNSSGLTSIEIPDSVASIGDNAFLNCDALATVTALPTTPPTLGGSSVFPSTIEAIYVPAAGYDGYIENWTSYSGKITKFLTRTDVNADLNVNSEYYIVPDNVGMIAENAFSDCPNLKGVVLPGLVTTIGEKAFEGSI